MSAQLAQGRRLVRWHFSPFIVCFYFEDSFSFTSHLLSLPSPAAPPVGHYCCLSNHHNLRQVAEAAGYDHQRRNWKQVESETRLRRAGGFILNRWQQTETDRHNADTFEMGNTRLLLHIATKPASYSQFFPLDHLQPAVQTVWAER